MLPSADFLNSSFFFSLQKTSDKKKCGEGYIIAASIAESIINTVSYETPVDHKMPSQTSVFQNEDERKN